MMNAVTWCVFNLSSQTYANMHAAHIIGNVFIRRLQTFFIIVTFLRLLTFLLFLKRILHLWAVVGP